MLRIAHWKNKILFVIDGDITIYLGEVAFTYIKGILQKIKIDVLLLPWSNKIARYKIGVGDDTHACVEHYPLVIGNLGIEEYGHKGAGNTYHTTAIKTGQAQILVKGGIVDQIGMKAYLPLIVDTDVATVVHGRLGMYP